MPTLTTNQITQYNITPVDQNEYYWYMSIDIINQHAVTIDYVNSTTKTIYPPIYGANIRELLMAHSSPETKLNRPPLPNSINIWKSAIKFGVEDQLNFTEPEVIGINMIHIPENIAVDYGAFPGVKLFYHWLPDFDMTKLVNTYKSLLQYKKITYQELETELAHMVAGDVYPNTPIITQQDSDFILSEI